MIPERVRAFLKEFLKTRVPGGSINLTVFGSALSGMAPKTSDIDINFNTNAFKKVHPKVLMKLVVEALKETGTKRDNKSDNIN
jgi:DNA polymerase sigma